ncbi:TonB-dependent receptor plug domain-containing protein [Marivirga salinarum]
MKKPALLLLISFSHLFFGYSQSSKQHEINSENESLVLVLEKLENAHNVVFKYKSEWVDTIRVDLKMKYRTIDEVLSQILLSNGFKYLKRDPNYYIILKNNSLDLNLNQKEKSKQPKLISLGNVQFENTNVTLSGYLISGEDNSPIIGATIAIDGKNKAISDEAGYYEIALLTGYHDFEVKTIDTEPLSYEINIYSSAKLDLTLFKTYLQLDDVVVNAKRLDENVSEVIAGKENITIEEIEKIPAFLGEADVIRSLLSLPGVNSTGEASTGFNVRGIGAGNNLILADGGLIFNTSHLLGVFSAFNPKAVSNVDFYKGVKPAKYGGRMGSVLDVQFGTGSKERTVLEGGVGILASNLNFETPIQKDKSSIQTSFRLAYPNYLKNYVRNDDLKNSAAFFGDGQIKYSDNLNENNQITLSTYLSKDNFNFANELRYDYNQLLSSLNWDHIYSDDLISSAFYSYSAYTSSLNSIDLNQGTEQVWNTSIEAHQFNLDYSWDKFENNEISFGVNNTFYSIKPREFKDSNGISNNLPLEQALETAIYFDNLIHINDKFSTYLGGRFTAYSNFLNSTPKNYYGFDPRVSLNYSFDKNTAVKLSYNRSRQFLHLISNTTSISPVDIRKLANQQIKPSISDQISFGFFKNFFNNNIETSIEVYSGWLSNVVDYRNGADLAQSKEIEEELLQGTGENYGLEVYAKKMRGDFTGWISYTYSRSLNIVNGELPNDRINSGLEYPSNFDQPHVLNVFTDYRFNRRLSLSFNLVYSTGRPATFPIAVYNAYGLNVADYSTRNNYRIPNYHRADISLHVAPPLKKYQKIRGSWTFTLYNLYSRRNAYSVFFRPSVVSNQLNSYKLSIIGNVIPAITYNFKLK